jgi:hypothetical protein
MERDIDLIRQILLDLEQEGAYTNWMDIDIEAYSPEQMDYHLELLVEAGLLNVRTAQRDHSRWLPVRLTWDGHEFLDAARDESRWQQLKASIAHTGSIPFEMIRAALLEMVRREASAHLPLLK